MRIFRTVHTSFVVMLASLGFAAAAHANVISVQAGSTVLMPNTPDQQITLLMTGSDFYTDSNLRMTINGGVGPAPVITHVFGDNLTAIPVGNLAGSIWQNGFGGIAGAPNGLTAAASFATAGFASKNTAGIYVRLTISTVGIGPGSYVLSLEGSELVNGLDWQGDPVPAPLDVPLIHFETFLTLPQMLSATPPRDTAIVLATALPPSTPVDLLDAISLTNIREPSYALEAATFTGPDAALFSVVGSSPFVYMSPDETMNFSLRFAGAVAPGTYTAMVTFPVVGNLPISYPLSVTVVPEPSTCVLALVGIVGLLVARRRRRSEN